MLRTFALAVALVSVAIVATPAVSRYLRGKKETCKVGAGKPAAAGAKRDAFIKKCMAGGNYEPPARRNAQGRTEAAVAQIAKRHVPPTARAVSRRSGAGYPAAKRQQRWVARSASLLSSRIRSSTPVTGSPSARTMVSRAHQPGQGRRSVWLERRDHRTGRILDSCHARMASRHRRRLCRRRRYRRAARVHAGSSSLSTNCAVLLATAKQMPCAPMITAVLMPMTSPTRG